VSKERDRGQTEPPGAVISQQRGHWVPDVGFVPLPPSSSSQARKNFFFRNTEIFSDVT